jgi:hypothetical protein
MGRKIERRGGVGIETFLRPRTLTGAQVLGVIRPVVPDVAMVKSQATDSGIYYTKDREAEGRAHQLTRPLVLDDLGEARALEDEAVPNQGLRAKASKPPGAPGTLADPVEGDAGKALAKAVGGCGIVAGHPGLARTVRPWEEILRKEICRHGLADKGKGRMATEGRPHVPLKLHAGIILNRGTGRYCSDLKGFEDVTWLRTEVSTRAVKKRGGLVRPRGGGGKEGIRDVPGEGRLCEQPSESLRETIIDGVTDDPETRVICHAPLSRKRCRGKLTPCREVEAVSQGVAWAAVSARRGEAASHARKDVVVWDTRPAREDLVNHGPDGVLNRGIRNIISTKRLHGGNGGSVPELSEVVPLGSRHNRGGRQGTSLL